MRRIAPDPFGASEASSMTAAEIAAALNVSQRTARALVEEALLLTDPGLRPVLDAMEEGRLDRRRARAVTEHACVLRSGKDAEFCAAAVELACPEDSDHAPSLGALSRRLRRLAEEYHEDPLAARKERAASFRKVEVEPAKDGMCWITAHLPVEVGAAIDTRLEALARSLQGKDEARGIGQLRADVFRDLLLDGSAHTGPAHTAGSMTSAAGAASGAGADRAVGAASVAGADRAAGADSTGGPYSAGVGAAGGVRMEVVVTVPARTLSGETDTPGEILGYGPIDAQAARLLAADAATWTTMWVAPDSGAPLALGRRRYTPSLAIRRFLGARDRVCRFPGCDKPASATEADHTDEWQNGGRTDVRNLALLCREHHRLKTLCAWKLRQVEPAGEERPEQNESDVPTAVGASRGGILEWTSPTGRRYVTCPESDDPPPF
ncbi:DUF222 domain-containing protein [Sinomonas sp.]|uniref:HNH endonuclease signature motif containing protein n=1 Tax=Sinomonas sp. TaxID=1914986 RepID=UPI003FA6DD4A